LNNQGNQGKSLKSPETLFGIFSTNLELFPCGQFHQRSSCAVVKIRIGGLVLGSSQFLLLFQLSQKNEVPYKNGKMTQK
jgi:hypothetical protein